MTDMKRLAFALMFAATPALAAGGPFFSLRNTNFVVTIAFILFVALLLKLKVPGMIGGLLDKRAEGIRDDLNAAKALHEEAKALLASYDRKKREMQEQAGQIVETAKREAMDAAEQAKVDLKASIARRLKAAEDQIASAEAAAVKEVRDSAVQVAVAAAGDLIASNMTAADRGALVDAAIGEVEAKLH
ncbi:F0F1 ATP synthase subunit B [Frigidibacter sp. SD6-1]|uniref:F0F1 ATP synthase subunit B n=1 Tax=Frigidibacter sp. SD6-1 TaxID=3032581 RepID=UPI0024DF3DC4|nr:F0F1 ATP synthase subunit B [Frigidibacter sp. SD6-1]